MTEAEHLAIARRLADLADRLYRDGDDVAAAEMLWGAVNRIIAAIALRHRLTAPGQQPRRGPVIHHLVSSHISDRQAALDLRDGMYAAGELHGHFYNSHLDQNGVAARVADTHTLIAELLILYRQHGRR